MAEDLSVKQKIKNIVLDQAKQGNLVFAHHEGLSAIAIDDFIKQPLDGMLYDLNRLPEITLSNLDDPKWMNDYAVYLTIKALKEFYDKHNDLPNLPG